MCTVYNESILFSNTFSPHRWFKVMNNVSWNSKCLATRMFFLILIPGRNCELQEKHLGYKTLLITACSVILILINSISTESRNFLPTRFPNFSNQCLEKTAANLLKICSRVWSHRLIKCFRLSIPSKVYYICKVLSSIDLKANPIIVTQWVCLEPWIFVSAHYVEKRRVLCHLIFFDYCLHSLPLRWKTQMKIELKLIIPQAIKVQNLFWRVFHIITCKITHLFLSNISYYTNKQLNKY